MTKIESKLEELGYTWIRDDECCKTSDSVRITLYAPSDFYCRKEWAGYLEALLCSYYDGDKQIKDVQTAWNILQSDLKELNNMEKENGN